METSWLADLTACFCRIRRCTSTCGQVLSGISLHPIKSSSGEDHANNHALPTIWSDRCVRLFSPVDDNGRRNLLSSVTTEGLRPAPAWVKSQASTSLCRWRPKGEGPSLFRNAEIVERRDRPMASSCREIASTTDFPSSTGRPQSRQRRARLRLIAPPEKRQRIQLDLDAG